MIDPQNDFKFERLPSPLPVLSPSQPSSSASPEATSALWTVPPTLTYFDGHFPNNPVLPAVAIMDVSLHLLRNLHQQPELQIQRIVSSKFMMPVVPKTQVQINIKTNEPSRWQIDWMSLDQKTCFAKLDLFTRPKVS